MAKTRAQQPTDFGAALPLVWNTERYQVNSMTSYGYAERESRDNFIAVEIKTVNHRSYLSKISVPEAISHFEYEIDNRLREVIERGSVQVYVKFKVRDTTPRMRINHGLAAKYHKELKTLAKELKTGDAPGFSEVMRLPGVVEEITAEVDDDQAWEQIKPVVAKALQQLQAMRDTEGRHLAQELVAIAKEVEQCVRQIAERSRDVVSDYGKKLLQRVNHLLHDKGMSLNDSDVLREISIFADKCDITEELARLHAHLKHMNEILCNKESKGRRLDFLSQEMMREANTISSKANDLAVSQLSVGLKTAVEKLKEQAQNIE